MTANCVRPVLGGLVILFSITTQAAPLRWSFHDALFDDGATLTGWFDFDADNSDGALHSFDIVVSGGSPAFPTVRFTPQTVDGPIFVFTQVFDTFAAVQNHSSDVPGAAFVAVNFETP